MPDDQFNFLCVVFKLKKTHEEKFKRFKLGINRFETEFSFHFFPQLHGIRLAFLIFNFFIFISYSLSQKAEFPQ